MKPGTSLHDRITALERQVQDLANQHQQIAVNHAELLKMILQLHLHIEELSQE